MGRAPIRRGSRGWALWGGRPSLGQSDPRRREGPVPPSQGDGTEEHNSAPNHWRIDQPPFFFFGVGGGQLGAGYQPRVPPKLKTPRI